MTLSGTVIYGEGAFEGEMKAGPGIAVQFTRMTPAKSFQLRMLVKRLLATDLMGTPAEQVFSMEDP